MKTLCLTKRGVTWIILTSLLSGLLAALAGDVSSVSTTNETNRTGEVIMPLKSGEVGVVSYGLFCLTSHSQTQSGSPEGGELIIALRNTGAKWINFDAITVDDFKLLDANGKEAKLYLETHSKGAGLGEAAVIYLTVDHSKNLQQPWTLRLKSNPAMDAPFEILINDIRPSIAIPKKKH